MVDVYRRLFDPRFVQFGLTALLLKFAVYFIQSQTMNYITPNSVVIRKGNCSATVHTFGATLTSWIVDGQEVLFLSKQSLFDEKKAIRGGIPVVFPQFGPWKDRPQHGFARTTKWFIKDERKIGSDTITLVLEDSSDTRKLWDYKFRFEYTITIINEHQLKMDAVISNTGDSSFPFTFLLHTYFSVPDILLCKISGLKGCEFIDKVKNGEHNTENRDDVTVSEFTDRIYIDTPNIQEISNVSGNRRATVEKVNLPDTVVWNPWAENAKNMSDFGDDEWKNMICIEAGYVSKPVLLEPKKSFIASQTLNIQ